MERQDLVTNIRKHEASNVLDDQASIIDEKKT